MDKKKVDHSSPPKNMRRWLLFGGFGFLGEQFIKTINTLFPEDEVRQSENRIRTLKDVPVIEEELKSWQPTHVFVVLGRTYGPNFPNIDYLEQKGRLVENVADNLFAPLVLASLADKMGFVQHVTYIGTGCIFDSYLQPEKTVTFQESDIPNFFGSQYSVVKGFTDQLFQHFFQEGKKVLNVRIRMPVLGFPSHRNLITKLRGFSKIISMPNSMTIIPQLFPILAELIVQGTTGTLNLVNPGGMKHDEILSLFSPKNRTQFEVVEMSEHDKKLVQAKRSNNILDTERLEKLCKEYELPLLSLVDGMKEMVKQYEDCLDKESAPPPVAAVDSTSS